MPQIGDGSKRLGPIFSRYRSLKLLLHRNFRSGMRTAAVEQLHALLGMFRRFPYTSWS